MKRVPVLVAVVLLAAGLAAWWRHAHPPFDMAATLKALADRQDLWENQFERNGEKAQALLQTAKFERDPGRRLSEREEAARQYLLAAQAEPAIALLKQLIDENPDAPAATRETLQFDLALAWMRLGEVQNCVGGHNAESCLVPIQGGGIHARRLGSQEAVRVLTALLSDRASTPAMVPTYRWLLNIAAMTLGDYPGKVDPRWLIPPSAFASETEFPHWQEVGLAHGLAINDRAGGAVLEDFDNDGDLDLLVSSWGVRDPMRYFVNDGHGRFTDASATDGLAGITGGLDLFQGDYDNDGLADVFVPRGAWAHKAGQFPGSLLHNDGRGHFTDVTHDAGVIDALPSQAAAWCDLDNDGWLDLVKGNELHADVDWPKGTRNVAVWRNDHHGHFSDIAGSAGVNVHGMIKAVACGDYDNDGWPDLYFSVIYGQNVLLHNVTAAHGGKLAFEDATLKAGVAEPVMSFTTWFFDYDNDGWEDLFVTGYQTDMSNLTLEYLGEKDKAQGARPRLYHNNHDGTFTDLAPQLGADRLTLTMGANFGDLDNDGWPDMYLGTGAPPLQVLDPSRMLKNDHGTRFLDVTTAGGFGHLQKGHAVAFGDIDGDGDQDLFEQIGGAFAGDRFWSVLFENPLNNGPANAAAAQNDWITLRLHGAKANRSAIGARIHVHETGADGPRDIYTTVGSGGTFGANSLQAEIGLGPRAKIETLTIRWPGSGGQPGAAQELGAIAADRVYEITEGQPAK